jgi:hypothetical protein
MGYWSGRSQFQWWPWWPQRWAQPCIPNIILTILIALHCHSWMVLWKTPLLRILSKHLSWCISRPHWYIPSCSGSLPSCISSYDERYLHPGKVSAKSINLPLLLLIRTSLVQQMGPWEFQLHKLMSKKWKGKVGFNTTYLVHKSYCMSSSYSSFTILLT